MTLTRSVRLSQTLVPFGVGAIYDYLGESLVACDTTYWKGRGTPIRLDRLADALDVKGFKSAPSSASLFSSRPFGLPYMRFPQWMFCASCRAMTQWSIRREVPGEVPRCNAPGCKRRPQLVPMRFVLTCKAGHLGDVPWHFWAHYGAESPNQKQCRSKELEFITERESGAGLESLRVRCRTCKASRSLQGITAIGSLRPLNIKCPGKQPWERLELACDCTEDVHVVQRGAGNLYFGLVDSAIDIPPGSAYDPYSELVVEITNSPLFPALRSAPGGPMGVMLIATLAAEFSCPEDRIQKILDEELAREQGGGGGPGGAPGDLTGQEWYAFLTPREEQDERDRFITRPVSFLDEQSAEVPAFAALAALVDRVVLATRLREVRALVGFTRYDVDGALVKPDLGRGLVDFLPAVEVFGEGVFVSLNEDALSRWEVRAEVLAAAHEIERRRLASLFGPRLPEATPRFLLLHTLAHLLVRQFTFDCGYSSSSLRERIYARPPEKGDPQAGILIYTAAGDVEGTLGGLARQGEPPRFARTLLAALESAAWCSADPICRESPGQGFGAMNKGACHACALIAETSCVHMNVMLDRAFVTGSERGNVHGFFADVLDAAITGSAGERG